MRFVNTERKSNPQNFDGVRFFTVRRRVAEAIEPLASPKTMEDIQQANIPPFISGCLKIIMKV